MPRVVACFGCAWSRVTCSGSGISLKIRKITRVARLVSRVTYVSLGMLPSEPHTIAWSMTDGLTWLEGLLVLSFVHVATLLTYLGYADVIVCRCCHFTYLLAYLLTHLLTTLLTYLQVVPVLPFQDVPPLRRKS